jgi:hypothetical protein
MTHALEAGIQAAFEQCEPIKYFEMYLKSQ